MRLIPVPESKLDCLHGVISDRIAESNLCERSDVSAALNNIRLGYAGRYMGAYVDSLESPKHCLIVSHFPGIATVDTIAYISLIYTAPSERGKDNAAQLMLQAAESYARLNGANILVGTSWLYRGSKGTDTFWKQNGFEIQETNYIKQLL